jgi:hypothetical protein
MSTRVQITLGELCDRPPLLPAPNISDGVSIHDALVKAGPIAFHEGPASIITHYRGNMLYLDNEDLVSRPTPITDCVNGHTQVPREGTEECRVMRGGKWYKATAVFSDTD